MAKKAAKKKEPTPPWEEGLQTERGLLQRCIFRYNNGEKDVLVDPVEIELRLQQQEWNKDEIEKIVNQYESENEMSADVLQKLIQTVRNVFEIPPLELKIDEDGNETTQGLSTPEVLKLMVQFFKFSQDLKKTEESNPILQELTELAYSAGIPMEILSQNSGSTETPSDTEKPSK